MSNQDFYTQESVELLKNEEEEKINSFYKNSMERYYLYSVNCDSTILVAKIQFQLIKYYRTVSRYIQRNYTRIPIYSDWKTKTSYIDKSLKLTNENLENLSFHEDPLIYRFSSLILIRINKPNLFPRWFILKLMSAELRHKIKIEEKGISLLNEAYTEINNNINMEIQQIHIKESSLDSILKKDRNKEKKVTKKINTRLSKNNYVLKSILSIGIYIALCSHKSINKLKTHLSIISQSICDSIKKQERLKKRNEELTERITVTKKIIELCKNHINKEISIYQKQFYINQSKVTPLPANISEINDFFPLKSILSFTYEKIIGCYVIRNNENLKYYVGQSKDVLKRIKQHFNGTEPKNIIFAKDYLLSTYQKKEDLFSVKIIRLNTKDELDKKEKLLIECYDSYNNGYNGTAGNT